MVDVAIPLVFGEAERNGSILLLFTELPPAKLFDGCKTGYVPCDSCIAEVVLGNGLIFAREILESHVALVGARIGKILGRCCH